MTLQEEWLRYERNTIPPSASEIQRREMFRAFMFGAAATFNMIVTQTSGPDRGVTHGDLNLLDGINGEVRAFLKSVEDGTDHPAGSLGGALAERSWINLYRRALAELTEAQRQEFTALFAGNMFDLSITFGKHSKGTFPAPAEAPA